MLFSYQRGGNSLQGWAYSLQSIKAQFLVSSHQCRHHACLMYTVALACCPALAQMPTLELTACGACLCASNGRYRDDLGHAIANFARVVPDGLLVFFPAYSLLTACLDHWKTSTGTGVRGHGHAICMRLAEGEQAAEEDVLQGE